MFAYEMRAVYDLPDEFQSLITPYPLKSICY